MKRTLGTDFSSDYIRRRQLNWFSASLCLKSFSTIYLIKYKKQTKNKVNPKFPRPQNP